MENQPKCEEKYTGKAFTCGRRDGILKEQRPDAVRTYAYNTKNQQTQVELEDGTVQTNRYDPEGLRHEMEENGKLLRFVYHKGELVYERGETEQTGTSYHQGAGTEALNRAGKIYYYHKDEQLSTAFITDEQGAIKNTYRYDAFGNTLDSMEQIENRIRYTGQQYDGITGQYYLRARYYNPAVGRFMQEDTYRGDGLNLYAYCANNPVTYYDPSGYAGKSPYVASYNDGLGGEGDNLVTVYRGTNNMNEIMIYDETGMLMSDSARRTYFETGDIAQAYAKSQADHEQWISIWGDEDTYIQAHGEFGGELSREFGIERSMISVTTDKNVAQYFAGDGGTVIEMQVSASNLHQQTIVGAGESEYLIINGTGR